MYPYSFQKRSKIALFSVVISFTISCMHNSFIFWEEATVAIVFRSKFGETEDETTSLHFTVQAFPFNPAFTAIFEAHTCWIKIELQAAFFSVSDSWIRWIPDATVGFYYHVSRESFLYNFFVSTSHFLVAFFSMINKGHPPPSALRLKQVSKQHYTATLTLIRFCFTVKQCAISY